MNAREKAQAGLDLLKKAVLEMAGEHPEGIRPKVVQEKLGLESPDEKGDHKDNLLWGVLNILRCEGKARVTMVGRLNRIYLCNEPVGQGEPQGTAAPTS